MCNCNTGQLVNEFDKKNRTFENIKSIANCKWSSDVSVSDGAGSAGGPRKKALPSAAARAGALASCAPSASAGTLATAAFALALVPLPELFALAHFLTGPEELLAGGVDFCLVAALDPAALDVDLRLGVDVRGVTSCQRDWPSF